MGVMTFVSALFVPEKWAAQTFQSCPILSSHCVDVDKIFHHGQYVLYKCSNFSLKTALLREHNGFHGSPAEEEGAN